MSAASVPCAPGAPEGQSGSNFGVCGGWPKAAVKAKRRNTRRIETKVAPAPGDWERGARLLLRKGIGGHSGSAALVRTLPCCIMKKHSTLVFPLREGGLRESIRTPFFRVGPDE